MRLSRTAGLTAWAFVGGAATGAILWSAQIQRSKRNLFGKSPVRRLAALAYLAGHPGAETAQLLSDYVGWEQRPVLRKRGRHLLRRMKSHLSQA